jgi:hypothetical protein
MDPDPESERARGTSRRGDGASSWRRPPRWPAASRPRRGALPSIRRAPTPKAYTSTAGRSAPPRFARGHVRGRSASRRWRVPVAALSQRAKSFRTRAVRLCPEVGFEDDVLALEFPCCHDAASRAARRAPAPSRADDEASASADDRGLEVLRDVSPASMHPCDEGDLGVQDRRPLSGRRGRGPAGRCGVVDGARERSSRLTASRPSSSDAVRRTVSGRARAQGQISSTCTPAHAAAGDEADEP